MQVVLAVLRTELAAVAVVARDQPLAAWLTKGGGINIGGFERAPERMAPPSRGHPTERSGLRPIERAALPRSVRAMTLSSW